MKRHSLSRHNKIKGILRLTLLLRLLITEECTIEAIACQFGVSNRTIERDLDIIRAAGYPVLCNDQKKYTIICDYAIPSFHLTSGEARDLIMWYKSNRSSDTKTSGKIESILAKIILPMFPEYINILTESEETGVEYTAS